MKYLMIQMGARMHYAVPAILARRGMLAEFWTDIHAGDWPARLARSLPRAALPRSMQSLLGRKVPREIEPSAVRSFPLHTLWHWTRNTYPDLGINRSLLRRGFGKATGLYSLMFGDADVICEAARQGLFVAFEQVISPENPPVVMDERNLFPGIEPQEPPENDAEYLRLHHRVWEVAARVLAPSDYVREGIQRLGGSSAKTRLVPYAVDGGWFETRPEPEPGRILFVGTVGLRKGSHYFAKAAQILRKRRIPCRFRAVGSLAGIDARAELFAGPEYTGPIPRTEVRNEFLRADVFVLPTLAEGSATAHIEALACGLPVVTTPNCGTLIRDGEEGFLVPPRDAGALADRIEQIVTDRALRERMSIRARALAMREHTWKRYEERLVDALTPGPPAAGTAAEVTGIV